MHDVTNFLISKTAFENGESLYWSIYAMNLDS